MYCQEKPLVLNCSIIWKSLFIHKVNLKYQLLWQRHRSIRIIRWKQKVNFKKILETLCVVAVVAVAALIVFLQQFLPLNNVVECTLSSFFLNFGKKLKSKWDVAPRIALQ
jgi:hypothetical protein